MEGGAIIANRLQPQGQQTESADSAQCLLPHNTHALQAAM